LQQHIAARELADAASAREQREREREQREARKREAALIAGQFEDLPARDHRRRAQALVAAITADPHRNRELAAHAAVAEAALAVADEPAELRKLLAKRLPGSPGD